MPDKIFLGRTDILSLGAVRLESSEQIVQSLPCNLDHSDSTGVERGGKTEYDIGFLIPNPTTHEKDRFFLLIEKNTEYPFTSLGKNKKHQYRFSHNEEMILSFYEDTQSSRDGGESGYTPTRAMVSYKPFKRYKLIRDADHPYVPCPVRPVGPYDEAMFKNTPEYKRYKKARNNCVFTIDCSMNEDGTLYACMMWVDTKKRIKAIDLAHDKNEIERENRALAFFSQRGIYYLVLLINKHFKKITALTLQENGLPSH